MNPHHFVFTQAGAWTVSARRPMDGMMVSAASPGEEEFALLAMGAASPYEALLFPERLEYVLRTADPADLPDPARLAWEEIFHRFLQAVHQVQGPGRLVLKSPTHGFRIATLARLFPRVRFVLVVREPLAMFESVVRMWQSMARLYAFTPLLDDDRVRDIVLADRLRFEEKLRGGLEGLSSERWTLLRYEDLVTAPEESLRALYAALQLEGFEAALPAFRDKAAAISDYRAAAILPRSPWRERVGQVWQPIAARYGYA